MSGERAADIVRYTLLAALPNAVPPSFLAIEVARRVSPCTITAELVMFDGQAASVELTRWAYGWSHRYADLPGGDVSFEDGAWRRVPRVGAAIACAQSGKGGGDE